MHPTQEASDQAETVTVPEPGDMMQSKPRRRTRALRQLWLLLRLVVLWPIVWMLWFMVVAAVLAPRYGIALLTFCSGVLLSLFVLPPWLRWESSRGFCLLLVALVGLGIALPTFLPYRHQHRFSPVGSIESVRAAIASYAADSVGNSFPSNSDIRNYAALVTIVNANGATLTTSEEAEGFTLRRYTGIDADQDGIYEDYTMSFQIPSIPAGKPGSVIFLSPAGLEKRER